MEGQTNEAQSSDRGSPPLLTHCLSTALRFLWPIHHFLLMPSQVVGVANSNSLVTASTDGKLCSWSLDMLTEPTQVVARHDFECLLKHVFHKGDGVGVQQVKQWHKGSSSTSLPHMLRLPGGVFHSLWYVQLVFPNVQMYNQSLPYYVWTSRWCLPLPIICTTSLPQFCRRTTQTTSLSAVRQEQCTLPPGGHESLLSLIGRDTVAINCYVMITYLLRHGARSGIQDQFRGHDAPVTG